MSTTDVQETPVARDAADAPAPRADHGGAIERWAPLAIGLLLALPTLIAAYPPATDLAYHEAEVSLLRHFGDRTMFPPDLYWLNPGHPNQLFHALALLVSFVVPVTLACRLVLAAAVVAIPLGAARFADHVGARRWTALLVAPLGIGWLFFLGLVANMLGLALLLALLPTMDRFVASPTPRGALKVVGACVALYFGHEAMLFIFVGAIVLFTLLEPLRPRATALRLAPAAFAIALIAAQLEYQKHLFTAAKDSSIRFMPIGAKLAGLPTCLFSAYDFTTAHLVFALVVVAIALGAASRVQARRASGEPLPRGLVPLARHFRFELVALVCGAGYLAAPGVLNGATFVYHRFLPPGFALAAILASGRRSAAPRRLDRLTTLLCVVAPVATLLTVWPAYVESTRNYEELSQLVPLVEKDSAIAMIGTTRDYTGYARAALAAHVLAERGGRMLTSFTESPIAPVLVRPDKQWIEPVIRTSGMNFCPSWDFTRFRYLLIDSVNTQLQALAVRALRPEGRLVAAHGEWMLFESTLPLVPIDSPDAVAPDRCKTDTMGARMDAQAEELEREWRAHPVPGVIPVFPKRVQ